ncbi:hypothetical protein Hypma_004522 [Hypsizygus marmoreus]|uniref:F-box domain-containing protein n=1 Tax=Hypsizygus marmoreus TaxID=39966 RepID=A0A369K8Y4_HYPMA|nr:hypothetical protein Hypma_004522 [Hypsizygus marmoreus]
MIVDDLKAQRSTAVAQADRIRTAFAPHKRLPPELLSAIFVYTLDPNQPLTFPMKPNKSWPWPLRAVCSRWRQIAISDRRLWTSMAFSVEKWSQDLSVRLLCAHLCTIGPCKSFPTRLAIEVGGSLDHRVCCNQPHDLVAFPSKLKDLSLSLPLPYLNAFLASDSSEYNYAFLESLSIDCRPHRMRGSWADWDDDTVSQFVDSFYTSELFGGMLNLRKLKIKFFRFFSPIPLCLMEPLSPWDQLIELDLGGMRQRSMMAVNILRRCERLESCRLWICDDSESMEIEEFALLHLRFLEVTGHSPGDLFFTQLIAPSLVELRVCVTTDEHDLIDILSMIRRSGSSLRVFGYITNDGVIAMVSGIEEFLELTPSLVEFDSFTILPQASLDKLSQFELWPFLEVWRCGVAFSGIDAFVDAIKARLANTVGGSNKLRDVWGRIPSGSDSDDVRVEAGLKRMENFPGTYGLGFKLAEDPIGENSPSGSISFVAFSTCLGSFCISGSNGFPLILFCKRYEQPWVDPLTFRINERIEISRQEIAAAVPQALSTLP